MCMLHRLCMLVNCNVKIDYNLESILQYENLTHNSYESRVSLSEKIKHSFERKLSYRGSKI